MRVHMDISDVAQMGPAMPARERILTTAYRLFTRRGIRAVGTDEVIAQSGVAKATLYRHFPSKNDLVLAVLQRREELWTLGLVERQSRLRGDTPEERLLAIFDVFHDWFQKHRGLSRLLVHQRFARAGCRSSGWPGQHQVPGQHPPDPP